MSHLFYRELDASMPVAVRGEGIYIIDRDGKRYIDACGGAAVSCLGHSHPKVIEAVQRQVADLAFAYSGFFTAPAAEELAAMLVEKAPGDLDKVFFVSGGSEAMEACLKLARQYFLETGRPERKNFIARRQSYHGNTLGALAVGGNALRRAPYQPLLMAATHISPCYAYRGKQPARDRRSLRTARRRRTRGGDPDARARDGRGLHRRAGRRRDARRGALRCRAISSASARSATGTACC